MGKKEFLKWPLAVAAAVVVLRVIAERNGAPHFVSASLSVAALTTVLAPLYFAIRIQQSKEPRPYRSLLMLVFIYVVCARAMVLPTYWAARIYGWHEPRFAGVDAPNPIIGFIALPVLTAAFWVMASMVSGGLVGSAVLAISKRSQSSA